MKILFALLQMGFLSVLPAHGQHRFGYATDPGAPAQFLRAAERDTTLDVIVEFVEEPLLLAKGRSLIVSEELYRSRFAQFRADIAQTAPAALSLMPRAEFFRIFFGVSTTVQRSMIPSIEKLSYVRRVHTEKEFVAHLDRSLSQIRVPETWTRFGVKGEGILVGIIDSGIDYLHPALGGGMGPALKVMGGYDFVNNDPDPMDDNGHGTHVAGIVAADGEAIQGVAPKAQLLAYKVLNAQGRGIEHNIIAAIERAVDPNQDGDPADMADIVNMSLGSEYGDPDDALSRTVDNAVKLGVTFCVSAGNAGAYIPTQGKEDNYYYTGMETIGSPGTARLAITVGAVDSLDALARFSSKGPSAGTFGVKPDLVAPGEDIWSLAPGGGVAQKSGTSMASPMVAGIAALLKSRNKGMTPAEVKSALMNSSVDLGLPAMKQGAGRVDAVRAMSVTTVANPGQLSFGLDDPAHVVWTKTVTLSVANRNGTTQTYSLFVTGTSPGIALTADPPAFVLSGGGMQTVLVTIAVDNRIVPVVEEDIIIHDGAVIIRGSADTLRIPWAFVRTSRLLLAFSEPGPAFLGASNTTMIVPRTYPYGPRVRWVDSRHMEVAGADAGVYDFAVYYPQTGALLLKEQVAFQASGTLSFDAQEAVHTLLFDGRDQAGLPFPPEGVQRSIRVDLLTGVPLYASLPQGAASLAVSGASTRMLFHPVESYVNLKTEKRVVLPQYPTFRGVSASRVLTPAALPYRTQTLRFKAPEGAPRFKLYSDVINIRVDNGSEYFNTIQVGVDTLEAAGGEASFHLALMAPGDAVYWSSIGFHVNGRDLTADYLDYSTRYFSVAGDSVLVSLPSQRSAVTPLSPDGGTLRFGSGPVHILSLSYNNSLGSSIQFDPRFRGGLLEERYSDGIAGTYAIFDQSGQKLTGGSLNTPRSPYDVAPGPYRVMIESANFTVSNARGKVTVVNEVDLTRAVPDAPYITSFAVLNSVGRSVDNLAGHETGMLRFSSRVQALTNQEPVADSTRVFYRTHRSAEWIPLAVTYGGNETKGVGSVFSASLAQATALDSAGIDLRVRVVDSWGNASDMIVAPAFAVGPWVDDGTSDVEDGDGTPAAFALGQNWPNPFNPVTTIGYSVGELGSRLQAIGSRVVKLAVYDLLGREVAVLVDEQKQPGEYTARWDAHGAASGVYFYRLTVGERTGVKKMTLLR